MKDILREYEAETNIIKKVLKPWRGMTIIEAREKGFGKKELALQCKLWHLGYKITALKSKTGHTSKKE